MEQEQKNKAFIINYLTAIAGVPKTRELLEMYIADDALIGHIEFFEAAFPLYEIFIDEMTAEGNRVVLQARLKATHLGEFSGIPPTNKVVDFPFVIRYEISDNKIISHWMLADQMTMMTQLGVMPAVEEAQ